MIEKASHTLLKFGLLSLLLLLSLPQMAGAETREEYPEEIATRIQQKYDEMASLSFSFRQKSQGQMSGRPRQGSGTAYFSKVDGIPRMRWNYAEPDHQVLVSDGETFSMYFSELEQMIITPAETLDNDLTYSFFSGRARIAEKFHILPPDEEYRYEEQPGSQPKAIKLVPREQESQVQSIHLWVDSESLIRRIEIRDLFDTVTQLNLSGIRVDFLADTSDASLAHLFSFSPPEGTEIIRQ